MTTHSNLEQAFLRGALAASATTAAKAIGQLDPDDFAHSEHATIAAAVYKRAQALATQAAVDPAAVMADLVDQGAGDTTRTAMIAVSTGNPPTPAELPRLAQALRTARIRRAASTVGEHLTQASTGSLADLQRAFANVHTLTDLAARAGLAAE